VNEPARITCPASSGTPNGASVLASQATPLAGWFSTAAATPDSSITSFAVQQGGDPPRVDVAGPHRPSAEHDARVGGVVRDGVDDRAPTAVSGSLICTRASRISTPG